MINAPINAINLQGRCSRIDVREGLSRKNAEFISVTFTIDTNGSKILIESFAMKYKANGELTGAFKSLDTLFKESKVQHKSIRKVGEKESRVIEDDTIVKDINECTAIRFSNWNGFKFTRFEENSYERDGEIIKKIKITTAFPNRVKEEEGAVYEEKADFEICGKVSKPVLELEDEKGNPYMQVTVLVPNYTEAYGDRKESVTLNEITLKLYDTQAFGYIEENFELGSFVYANGTIVRRFEKVEVEEIDIDETKGFGRQIKHEQKPKTKPVEYLEILGGYRLEEDEIEDMKEFNQELWEEFENKKEEPVEQPSPNHTFGRDEQPKKSENLSPFGDDELDW